MNLAMLGGGGEGPKKKRGGGWGGGVQKIHAVHMGSLHQRSPAERKRSQKKRSCHSWGGLKEWEGLENDNTTNIKSEGRDTKLFDGAKGSV